MTSAIRLLHDPLLLHGAVAATAGKIALIDSESSCTYGQLRERALRLAAVLRARGIERGDRVVLFLDNHLACATAIYATSICGGVFVLVNTQTKADKLRFILEDCTATALICEARLAEVYEPACADLQTLRAILRAGEFRPEGVPAGNTPPVEALEDALAATEPMREKVPLIPLDLAALIYTSGSTGQPKGVMQTHLSMTFAAGSIIEYLRLDASARLLCALPLAFDYGLYQLLMAVTLGGTLVLERSFAYPAQVFRRMQEHEVNVFPGVPTMFALLLAAHRRSSLSFPNVRCLTNTAAALPAQSSASLREIFPNALLFRMYGLTECKRVCYLEPELEASKPGSVGRAIPGTEIFLLDGQGHRVGPGGSGILHVRGPHVMLGYWNRPDLSAQMLITGRHPGERVLCTHDLFRMDEDGDLYFLGRTDDIIKSRGEKVSPVEVESALHAVPGVREAAVIGVPDDVLGEAIRAFVVLHERVVFTEREIRLQLSTRLEAGMMPREIVICAELPKTATGKVSKRLLRDSSPACLPKPL